VFQKFSKRKKKNKQKIIDSKKRAFIKKGLLGIAGLGGLALGSKMVNAGLFYRKFGVVNEEAELKNYSETLTTANTSTAYTIDLTNGNVFDLTLTGNCTFTFSSPPVSGKAGSFTLILTQDGTGSRTVTWPAAVDWAGGTAPTLTTTATTGVDVITFVTVDGGTTWLGFLAGGDMK